MMVGRDVTFKVEKKEKEPGEVVLSVKICLRLQHIIKIMLLTMCPLM